MTALILELLALVLLDVAVIAGWTPDSRDGRDWWCRREWPATLTPGLVAAGAHARTSRVPQPSTGSSRRGSKR
jgi:hypothetical protein